MGSCGAKSRVRLETEIKLEVPHCYYYSRKKDSLFEISSGGISKYIFKNNPRSNFDSCVGVVGDNRIIIAGGRDPNGLLSKRVLLINAFSKAATELAPLPRAAKEGNLLESRGFYYYIGGTVHSEDPNPPIPEEGSPIMRYNILNEFWEVFTHSSKNRKGKGKGKGKGKEEKKINEEELSLKNLIGAGGFIYNGRIYLVGGKIYQNGGYQATDKIFSVGIENEGFDMREESLKLPVKLVNPVCASGGTHAFITGGFMENGYPSVKMFVIKFSKNEICECHGTLDSPLDENYPPAYLENEVVIFSFPKLWIKPKHEDKSHIFVFNRKNTKNNQNREITLVDSRDWKPSSEKDVDLSISFQIDQRKDESNAGSRLDIGVSEESKGSQVPKIKKIPKQKKLDVDDKDNNEYSREKKQKPTVIPMTDKEEVIRQSLG